MQFFARMSPLRAVRDLRLFLRQRQKHELIFLFLSIFITGLLLIGFAKDSKIEKEYRPNIVYVQQWTLDRTDAEIKAGAQAIVDQGAFEPDGFALAKVVGAVKIDTTKTDVAVE